MSPGLDLRVLRGAARRASAGASQGQRPTLAPGQRRRRRRLDQDTAQFGTQSTMGVAVPVAAGL